MATDDDDVPPLTEREIEQIRGLLKSDERVAWFWSTIKVWATWIAAILVAYTLCVDALKRVLQALVK